jgi:hypothetical protein
MARARTVKHSKPPQSLEPEDISQDIESQQALEATPPDEEPEAAPRRGRPPKAAPAGAQASAEAISKAEAVRRALAAGKDSPSDGVPYIKQEFGIDIAPTTFSATKSQLKNRKGAGTPKGKPGRKPRTLVEDYVAPPSNPPVPGAQPDLLAALKAIKPLVAQMGADKVHEIVDLLG